MMGASSSSVGDDEGNDTSGSAACQISDPNFRFLMGKVKNVGPAAKRLFDLGKLYLSPDDSEQISKDRNDFKSLFPTVSDLPAEQEQDVDRAFQLFRPLKKMKPLHHGQTYVQWKVAYDYQSSYVLCMQQRNIIYIQPIDDFPEFVRNFKFKRGMIQVGLFELIQGFAQIFFSGMDVVVLSGMSMEDKGWSIASRYTI